MLGVSYKFVNFGAKRAREKKIDEPENTETVDADEDGGFPHGDQLFLERHFCEIQHASRHHVPLRNRLSSATEDAMC
jgi:hypothetical protein